VRHLVLVGSAPERTGSLSLALAREGFAVKVAPEAFYALTMIERERSALVLLDGADGALPAADLAAIVRADPALREVTLALAIESSEPVPAGFDLVLDGAKPRPELAAWVRRLTANGRSAAARVLSGSLDAQDLWSLTGTLGQTRRTGRLSLVLPGERLGEAYFDQGQVVHARVDAQEGRTAFITLFEAAREEAEVPFDFELLTREEIFRYPRTLGAGLQGLLLHTATVLDRGRPAGQDHRQRIG